MHRLRALQLVLYVVIGGRANDLVATYTPFIPRYTKRNDREEQRATKTGLRRPREMHKKQNGTEEVPVAEEGGVVESSGGLDTVRRHEPFLNTDETLACV